MVNKALSGAIISGKERLGIDGFCLARTDGVKTNHDARSDACLFVSSRWATS